MAKKYNIPFRSLSNVSCLIEIWDRNYTGSVIELSASNPNAPGVPAADPIYIEEDSNDNLMQPLRSKTGYINLVETTAGGLSSLRPLSSTALAVYFYYGSTLCFFGYIQAQSFGDDIEQPPRIMQIPICSPLELMRGQTFSIDTTLADVMLGNYLDECLSYYDSVIIPLSVATDLDQNVHHPLQLRVDNRLVCPWNEDYDFGVPDSYQTTVSPYAPISYEEFLTAFCNLFGLVAHEFGKTVVFSRFDYNEQYVRLNVGDLQDDSYTTVVSGDSLINIPSSFVSRGVDNTAGLILPVRGVKINYGDFVERVDMDLTRAVYVANIAIHSLEFNGVVLNKQTRELDSPIYNATASDLTNVNHVRIIGDDGSTGMLDVRAVYDNPDTKILSYTFTSVPASIAGAEIKSTFGEGFSMRMQVYSGGKYYNTDHDWQSTPAFIPITFHADGYCKNYDVAANGHTITISLFPGETGVVNNGIISQFSLLTFPDPLRRYKVPTHNYRYIKGTSDAVDDVEVTTMFHNSNGNSGIVYGGTASMPDYAYMLTPRPFQKVEVKATSAVDMETLYLRKLRATGMSEYARLVATEFHPWNDKYILYIQGSNRL